MEKTADQWRLFYSSYISSARWKNIRKLMIKHSSNRCTRCNTIRPNLELHHKTYERLGSERISDLEVLCVQCHEIADMERAIAGEERSREALYDAIQRGREKAMDTYMSKKYGNDWYLWRMGDYEEFDQWIERKELF